MEIKTKNSLYGNCQYWEQEDKDGVKTITQYYSDHTHRVMQKRNELKHLRNQELKNHELIGKKFFDGEKECVVQSVYKQWTLGYYEVILYYSLSETKSELLCTDVIDGKMYGRSHGTKTIKNINCHYPLILEDIVNIEFYD